MTYMGMLMPINQERDCLLTFSDTKWHLHLKICPFKNIFNNLQSRQCTLYILSVCRLLQAINKNFDGLVAGYIFKGVNFESYVKIASIES